MRPQKYKDFVAISQSLLTLLSQHPKYAKFELDRVEERQIFNRNFDIGSYVDAKLTGGDVSKFTVMKNNIPDSSTKPGQILKRIIEQGSLVNLDSSVPINDALSSLIWESTEAIGLGGDSWSDDRKWAAINKSGLPSCLKEIYQAYEKDQIIVDSSELMCADNCVQALKEDPNTLPWFEEQEDETLMHQVELYWDQLLKPFSNSNIIIPCKGLCDVIRINHKEKTIRLGDLKTTEYANIDTFATPKTVLQYRLDLQAYFYILGANNDPTIKNWIDQGYKLEENYFDFVVVSKKSFQTAVVTFHIGLSARTHWISPLGKLYKGVHELLEDYHFHQSNDLWNHPREFYENNFYFVEIN